jgi:hypothetical protein
MSLADTLSSGPHPRPRDPGIVGRWVAKLDAADRAAFELALVDPDWSTSALWRLAKAAGLAASLPQFNRYRTDRP